MKITVVRHGQTTGNIGRIVESRIGGVLTEKGIAQAKEVGETLKGRAFDAIYCSDMQRCIDTATYIREHHPGTPFFVRDDIRELGKGKYDGGSWDDLPEYIDTDTYITTRFEGEGGESWSDVEERVRKFLSDIFVAESAQVLVVTHDGVLKVMGAIFQSISLHEAIHVHYENAAVYEWDYGSRL